MFKMGITAHYQQHNSPLTILSIVKRCKLIWQPYTVIFIILSNCFRSTNSDDCLGNV